MQLYALGLSKQPGVKWNTKKVHNPICQEFGICGPEKKMCLANQTLKDESCLVSCDGLYADIEDDSLKQNVVKGR